MIFCFIGVIPSAYSQVANYIPNTSQGNYFTDENKLVLTVYYKVTSLNKINAYQHNGSVFLPMGTLSNILGFNIRINPRDNTAEGWILRENNIFVLDGNKGKVVINGQEKTFSKNLVIPFGDEIYIESSLLSSFWPVNLDINYLHNKIELSLDKRTSEVEKIEIIKKWLKSSKEGNPTPNYGTEEEILINKEKIQVVSDDSKKENYQIIVEEDSLVLQPMLNNKPLGEDFIEVIEHNDEYFVPVSNIADLLELKIDVSPREGIITGWIITEDRKLNLNINNNTYSLGNKKKSFDAKDYIKTATNIYLESSLFSQILPVKFKLEKRSLTLDIISQEKLPIEKRLAREEKHKNLISKSKEDEKYPVVTLPYSMLSYPFLDMNLGYGYNIDSQKKNTKGSYNYSVHSSNEMAHLTTQIFSSGDDRNGLSNLRMNAGRKDVDGKLLGPMNATEFVFGDIYSVDLPLISSGGSGRGANVSNRALTRATEFDLTTFEGDALPGWEIELYRNGLLLAFQKVEQDGRYQFKEVPILYGNNIFQLIFYGPQGQIREETKRIQTSDALLKKGKFEYQASLDQKSQSLSGIESNGVNNKADQGNRAVASFDYGLTDKVTIGIGGATLPTTDGERNYATNSLKTSIFGALIGNDFAYNQTDGGWANKSVAFTSFNNIGVKLEHSLFNKFSSGNINRNDRLKSTSLIDLNSPVPFLKSINMGLSAKRDKMVDSSFRDTLTNRLSTSMMGVSFSNFLNFIRNSSNYYETPTGTGSISGNIGETSLRANINYRLKQKYIEGFSISAQRNLKKNLIANISLLKNFGNDRSIKLSTSLNWDLPYYKLGFRFEGDSKKNYYAGLNLAFAFGREPRKGEWFMQGGSMSREGGYSARAFIDKNLNGVLDKDEEILKNVGYKVEKAKAQNHNSKEKDVVFGTRMPAYRYSNLVIDDSTLDNALWVPKHKGYSLLSRPGTVVEVDFPILTTSEIDGNVVLIQDNQETPLSGIDIELIDKGGKVVKKLKSEFDGFYVFNQVLPGKYKIRVKPSTLDKLKLVAKEYEVEVTDDSDIYSGNNFYLAEKSQIELDQKQIVEKAITAMPTDNAEFEILLGVYDSYQKADIARFEIQGYYGYIFKDLRPAIQKLYAEKNISYNLKLLKLTSERATKICEELSKENQACYISTSKPSEKKYFEVHLGSFKSYLRSIILRAEINYKEHDIINKLPLVTEKYYNKKGEKLYSLKITNIPYKLVAKNTCYALQEKGYECAVGEKNAQNEMVNLYLGKFPSYHEAEAARFDLMMLNESELGHLKPSIYKFTNKLNSGYGVKLSNLPRHKASDLCNSNSYINKTCFVESTF
jgi:formylmethanofuran dehydrogenase subunit D